MRKLLLFIFAMVCASSTRGQGTQIQSGPTNPPTCTVGMAFFNTTSNILQACGPANTWAAAGATSPSSLTTYFSKFYGVSPDDCGNATCTTPVTPAIRYLKFCNDGVITGQPTTTFSSSSTKTLISSSITNNQANFVFTNTTVDGTGVLIGPGQSISVTGSTHNAVFNVTNLPVVAAASGSVTVNLTNANIGSAADTGTITTTVGCANFQAADASSVIEIVGVGPSNFPAGGTGLSTTISSVQSALSVTLGATATSNVTGVKFWYGTDATTATQNWVTAINAGIPTATGVLTHSGYIPGLYLITKPLRFINPLGGIALGSIAAFSGNMGFGPPEPFQATSNENEGLSLLGQTSYRTGFAAGSQFNFQFPNTSVNNGIVYFSGYNGSVLQNFFVGAADYTSLPFNTSTNTGSVACWMDDGMAHEFLNGIQIENCHNSTSTLTGHYMTYIFQQTLQNMQIYQTDCGSTFQASTGIGSDLTVENVTWWSQATTPTCSHVNINSFSENMNFVNVNIFPGTGSGLAALRINNSNDTSADEVKWTNSKMICASNQECIVWANTAGSGKWSFTNVNLQSAGTGTGVPIDQLSANAIDVHFNGGSVSCSAACASGINNVSGGTIHLVGTRLLGTVGVSGTGSGSVLQFIDSPTGWTGAGNIQGTTYIANQGTACTNGELALSAGWQSTGSATVTAVAGGGQTCSWTITTGTTTAANPTVTDTLTNALPTATTVCEMNIHGGTHTAAAGEGFTNTTLSATAPVFTFIGTPTAGGTTYFVTRRCGP